MAHAEVKSNFQKNIYLGLLIVLPLGVLLLALWLFQTKLGASLGGLIEEWDILGLFTEHGPMFWINDKSVLAAHKMRPLTVFPHSLAFHLDPNSFFYWHILLGLSLLLKGIAAALLSWKIFKNRFLTVMGGLLFVLYPADTMQLAFRSIHINWAVALSVFGLTLFAYGLDEVQKAKSVIFKISGVISFITAGLMYEAAYSLCFFPLLYAYFTTPTQSFKKDLKSAIWKTKLWFGTIATAVGYFVFYSAQNSYQSSVIGSPKYAIGNIIDRVNLLFKIGMSRAIFGGWIDAFKTIVFNYQSVLLAVGLFALFAGLGVWLFAKLDSKFEDVTRIRTRSLFLLSFAMAGFGYAPYLASTSHIAISQRTYLFAAFGASLFFVVVLFQLLKKRKKWAYSLAVVLLTLGFSAQLNQMLHYMNVANHQKHMLAQIIKLVPQLEKPQSILIFDKSSTLSDVWFLKGQMLTNALSYMYGHPVSSDVCMMPGLRWSSMQATAKARAGECVINDKNYEIKIDGAVIKTIEKKNAIVININEAQEFELVTAVDAQLSPSESTQNKFKNILASCVNRTNCPWSLQQDYIEKPSFRWDFGYWWSLDTPTPGVGWRGTEWSPSYTQALSLNWKNEEVSSLVFEMKPLAKNYELKGEVKAWTFGKAKEDLKISINSQLVEAKWVSDTKFVAEVEQSLLKPQFQAIYFDSPVDPETGVSLAFDWVELKPKE